MAVHVRLTLAAAADNDKARQANTCTCTRGTAATEASSLAPALVTPRLLGLLALPMARKLVQVATRASSCMAMQVRPRLAHLH